MTKDAEQIASEKNAMFLGNYIVIFQHIESKLNQILQMAMGEGSWHFTQIILTELSNSSKIRIVRSILNSALSETEDKFKQDWLQGFNALMNKVADEAQQRNHLVHGTYDYTAAKLGGPVICFYKKAAADGLRDKTISMTDENCEEILEKVSGLATAMNFAFLQIISWCPDLFNDPVTG
ncbi:hypothetical protein [Kordiimonas marina]|uniref:hypothetical protein n=1 Tax=Kordiimonas marina TaxID=2872312 RepID=UPI001FF3AD2B|nr:hypothetical protein [Kordiimonas marina]MCJ9430761.1 hypothetical protein [Kordiimonas marina]